MNGNSYYIIYVIDCNKMLQHVGQTKRKLKERLNNHSCNIKLRKQTSYWCALFKPISHVNDVTIIALEQTDSPKINLLLRHEL